MATQNRNIGQYRGAGAGAYRNPRMIVEDPLVGLKSFQQSYGSMFAQVQAQKANDQKKEMSLKSLCLLSQIKYMIAKKI
jgi:hypothetical protein